MAVNSYGAVAHYDFGQPKIISATAKNAISGGQAVTFSGADIVSSGPSSFAGPSELYAEAGGSGLAFGGVALEDVGSNTVGAFLIGNTVIAVEASGAVSVSQAVAHGGGDYYVTTSTAGQSIGRAVSSASAKDKWFLLNLNG